MGLPGRVWITPGALCWFRRGSSHSFLDNILFPREVSATRLALELQRNASHANRGDPGEALKLTSIFSFFS